MKALRVLTGWFPVAAKEGRATILSPRLIIIAAILALAILGSAYGITAGPGGGAGTPTRLVYDFVYWPDLNFSRPAMALFLMSPTGEPRSGVEVQLVNASSRFDPVGSGEYEVLETKATDASGWVRFEGLVERYPDRELALVLPDEPNQLYGFASTYDVFSGPVERIGQLRMHLVAFGAQDRQVLSLVFADSQGVSVEGADVFLWRQEFGEGPGAPPGEQPPGGWEPYWNGTTDPNGYYLRPEPLESGIYLLRVAKGELNSTGRFGFSAGPSPFGLGPDGVLAFSGLIFIPLILPIMAMVLGYDAIVRERAEGSLDLLLSKPVGRLGVALGKLIGAFASMAIPVAAVILTAAGLIWLRTDQAPTVAFLASFLGEALLLLLLYTVLFLAISSLVRNLGTALLVSVLSFLLFAFFWSLIAFLLASLLAPAGSPRWFEITVTLSLFTPTGIYQQLLFRSLPELAGGFFGPFGGAGALLPAPWVVAAALVWIIVPLALFLWAMKYRVTEG